MTTTHKHLISWMGIELDSFRQDKKIEKGKACQLIQTLNQSTSSYQDQQEIESPL